MAKRQSRMLDLGTAAPPFALADGRGVPCRLDDLTAAPALLVAFICNHCPYVVHVLPGLIAYARDYTARGLAIVAISANDASAYPADAPGEMAALAERMRFPFPYLYDPTQEVALAYGAVCTPDFFLFNAERRLAYRGQFDASRPGSGTPITGSDLRAASDRVLSGLVPDPQQSPSVGCSIKWLAGKAPAWA